MPDIKVFDDVVVSGVEFDFSQNAIEALPHQFYREWAELVVAVSKAVCPSFEAPPFPDRLELKTESMPSDGPYPASEDYYLYDLSWVQLVGAEVNGLEISIESGRQDRDPNVNINSVGFHYGVSSHIYLTSPTSLATFYVFPNAADISTINAIMAEHREKCVGSGRRTNVDAALKA